MSMFGHGSVYLMAPKNAAEQSRYWNILNNTDHRIMTSYIDKLTKNKDMKKMMKKALDPIETNMKIYVPMLTQELSLGEAESYDSLTDEKFCEFES